MPVRESEPEECTMAAMGSDGSDDGGEIGDAPCVERPREGPVPEPKYRYLLPLKLRTGACYRAAVLPWSLLPRWVLPIAHETKGQFQGR